MGRGRVGGRSREIRALAVVLGALGLFWLLAALTYAEGDGLTRLFGGLPEDVCGRAGRQLAAFSVSLVGGLTAPALPLLLMVAGAWLWMPSLSTWVRRSGRLVLGWLLVAPPVLALAGGDRVWGGAYGELTGGSLNAAFGRIGAWILLVALLAAGSLILGRGRPPAWLRYLGRALRGLVTLVGELGRKLASVRLPEWRPQWNATPSPFDGSTPGTAASPETPAPDIPRVMAGEEPAPPRAPAPVPAPRVETPPAAPTAVAPSNPDPDPGLLDLEPLPKAAADAPVRRVRRAPEHRKRPLSEFEPPPETLFSDPPPSAPGKSRDELVAESELLRRTLEEFGIRGRVGEVHPGPVITRYDFEPAPGIKVNQIVNREDDIALALRSDRVRILSRVPGKAAVGIEIPNESPEIIHFRDVIASRAYRESRGVLTLALGKTTAGRPFCDGLESMPHLLVAGATGSGKSVCLNTIIVSLLFRHSPENLRLIMIDPKMLELTGYNGIPHLALPVVTESKEAAKALNWLVREMERRYRVLAERGVRNIGTYRDRFFPDGVPAPVGKDEAPPEPMPYFVCIVDELADLMMTFASEVEAPVARLAQMARAVGIHLILATQRPSVDVITGVIKANFPARIAFQVASRTDSRTILDGNGAESLIGRGDMLYLPPGRPAPTRVHGAFLSDADIEALVDYLKGFAAGVEPIDIEERSGTGGGMDGDADSLFTEAARLVVLQGQASTSFIQRRLKVGYARAGRLMDQLEQAGIVGAHEGSKAREVLVDIGYLEEQGIL